MALKDTRRYPEKHQASQDDCVLLEAEAANFLRVSTSFLRNARVRQLGPAYLRLGRAIRYRLTDLQDWLAGQVGRP
jgi:hypothetical protein